MPLKDCLLPLLSLAIQAANAACNPGQVCSTSSSLLAWPSITYKTEPWSSPLLNVTKVGETAPGLIWLAPAMFFPQESAGAPLESELSPLLVTQEGDLVFHGPNYTPGQPAFYTNFRPQFYTNGTILSYYLGEFGPSMEQSFGNVTFINDRYEITNVICMADYPVYIPGNKTFHCKVDLHESRRISDDKFIITIHNITQTDLTSVGGPKDGWVTDSQFLIINPYTEEIYFKWASLEHLNKLPVSDSLIVRYDRAGQELGVVADLPWDYFHINSVAPFEDGFVISARHFSEVVFIDGQGNITYRLSGAVGRDFTLGNDAHFGYQHDALAERGDDGMIYLSMFDDANYDIPPAIDRNISSGLRLKLNTENMTATLDRRLFNNETIKAIGLGKWQDFPEGHVFIDFASSPMLSEFDGNSKEIYNMQYGYVSPGTFRASKYDNWTATPGYPPKGFAEKDSNDQIAIYMSWNGATEIASWEILSSPGMETLTNVTKRGFETMTTISQSQNYSQFVVVAKSSNGTWLGHSTPFSLNTEV